MCASLSHFFQRCCVYNVCKCTKDFFTWFGNILIVLGLWDLLKRIRPPYILSLSLGIFLHFLNSTESTSSPHDHHERARRRTTCRRSPCTSASPGVASPSVSGPSHHLGHVHVWQKYQQCKSMFKVFHLLTWDWKVCWQKSPFLDSLSARGGSQVVTVNTGLQRKVVKMSGKKADDHLFWSPVSHPSLQSQAPQARLPVSPPLSPLGNTILSP